MNLKNCATPRILLRGNDPRLQTPRLLALIRVIAERFTSPVEQSNTRWLFNRIEGRHRNRHRLGQCKGRDRWRRLRARHFSHGRPTRNLIRWGCFARNNEQ